jgi:hypothetical protein
MPKTVLTLTVPEHLPGDATLLIQRGAQARVQRFRYTTPADLTTALTEALSDLPEAGESAPPKPSVKRPAKPTSPDHLTVDVPRKKGTRAVKASHIQIVGGAADAAAYRQAVVLAGRLMDGNLWDGRSPIGFDGVYRVADKMKYLTDRDFALFTLADFVRVGENTPETV